MELLAPNLTLLLWTLFSACTIFLALAALLNWLGARFTSRRLQMAWLCIILFIPIAGPVYYFVAGKKHKINPA